MTKAANVTANRAAKRARETTFFMGVISKVAVPVVDDPPPNNVHDPASPARHKRGASDTVAPTAPGQAEHFTPYDATHTRRRCAPPLFIEGISNPRSRSPL